MNNKLCEIIEEDIFPITNLVDFSEINNKTVLITGASGLIGIYLLASLKKVIERFSYSVNVIAVMQSKPLFYMNEFLNPKYVKIYCGDLTDYDFAFSLPNADYIIHAAGYAQPGKFLEKPEKTIKLNAFVTQVLCEKLNKTGKLLFISTSELYSGLSNPPFNENQIGNTNTTHPRSCYIDSKRCGEAICNAFKTYGIQAKSARLSLAYGPGTRKGDKRVLNSFIERALNGKLTMMDHGSAKRTYCYISDAIEIMWNILFKGKEAIYNVGGNSKITIRELAECISKNLNVPLEFPKDDKELSGAPVDVCLDMTRVKEEFGKIKYIDFNKGLRRTIDWQKELYKVNKL